MRLRNTLLTGAASYIQMGVLMLTQLAAIPLALHYLDTERFGLWSFTAQSLGYLLLLDFGVSNSIGRLMAEPLHAGDEKTWNGWFNMILVIQALQGILVLGAGLLLADSVLHWFNIPAALIPEARQLWLMALVLFSINFPFRMLGGILTAQNRYYHFHLATALGSIVWLGVFFVCLHQGFGSRAYGISLAAQMLVTITLPLAAVVCGPNRFRLCFHNIPWHHARELFGFSSAVFICGIAIQVAFMSQSLIITKILGLGAVAAFTVCSRVPMLLMQLIWRPFDAFNARWQIFWAKGELETLNGEFAKLLRLTIGLALLAMTCCMAMNRWFVFIFGKQALYQGKEFDFFFVLFVIAQVWTHCLSYCFGQAKKMKGYAMITMLDTVLTIFATVVGTKFFGLSGFIGFAAIYGLLGAGFWYITIKAPRLFGLSSARLFTESAPTLGLFLALQGIGLFLSRQAETWGDMPLLFSETGLALTGLGLFIVLFWKDLKDAGQFFRQSLVKRHDLQTASVPAP